MIVPELDELVSENHEYRKILKLFNWTELTKPLRTLYSKEGRKGYSVEQGFKILFLQFLKDLSDREMEERLKYDLSFKYFANFGLKDKTPDHSYFGNFRKRIGAHQLSNIFRTMVESFRKEGLVRQFYTFVDASKIEANVDSWRARDKAIADKENQEKDDNDNPTMNNRNVSEYSSDPDARYGAKGKNDIWFGYKRHLAVDMASNLITKVSVTAANIPDGKALRHVVPKTGAVVADKAYSVGEAKAIIKAKGLHAMTIEKQNSKTKNREKDKFISSLRMPFEGIFSKIPKRTRYRTKVKVYFQAVIEAIVTNIKRLLVLDIQEPIPIT